MTTSEKNELRGPVFDGHRFKGGNLPLEMLPEMVTYQRLINEAGYALWAKDHPEAQRIPVTAINEALALGLHEIVEGSADTRLLPIQEAAQGNMFPDTELLYRAIEQVNKWFQAACDNTSIGASRHVIQIMSRFGMKFEEDDVARFGTKNWDRSTKRRVEELSKTDAIPKRCVYVGTLVALSDTKRAITLQPLVGAKFEVPFDQHRTTILAGFNETPDEGKPFVRVEILGLYFEKILERATSTESISIIGGPEFDKRWSFIQKQADISPECKYRAKSLLADIIICGVQVRPYIYVDEGEIVFEWPHQEHGVVTIQIGEAVQLLTAKTDLEEKNPTAKTIAKIISETP